MNPSLAQRGLAEFLGTAFLPAAVVGSGIMGEKQAGGNVAIALLANSLATGAMLVVLILIFAPVSGAHFNPSVRAAFSDTFAGIAPGCVPAFIAAQFAGMAAAVAAGCLLWRDDPAAR